MRLYASNYKSSSKENIRTSYLLCQLDKEAKQAVELDKEAKQAVQVVGTCILLYWGVKKTLESSMSILTNIL